MAYEAPAPTGKTKAKDGSLIVDGPGRFTIKVSAYAGAVKPAFHEEQLQLSAQLDSRNLAAGSDPRPRAPRKTRARKR